MHEPWMMLDMWGNPVTASVLDRMVCRAVGLDECRGLVAREHLPSGFLAKYREGDSILWYTSRQEDWEANMGSEGYVLVREGYLVESCVLRMN